MKHFKLFFALFAMLALGVGNAWGETTISFGFSNWDGVTANFSGTAKDEVTQTVDGVKVTYTRNGSNLYSNTTAIRFYKSNTLKFDAPTGYSIQSIAFTCSSYQTDITSNVGTCTATSSNLSWSGDATSVTFTRPSSASSYATITGATVTLAATSGGSTPDPGTGEGGDDPDTPGAGGSGTIVIKYNSTFTPSLPTASGSVNTTATAHTAEGLSFKEKGIYKGSSNNYLMFVQNKGFIYNTQSLGTITSVSVTYTSRTSTSGKAGVYFGTAEQSTYTTTSNNTIKGQNQTETWTNTTEGNGFFQLSTSNKNVQITQIAITYTSGSEGGGTEEPVASVKLTPDEKNFGTINVGETLSQEFTITTENTTATLSAEISNTTDYAISDIADNKITVTYQPQTAETHEATLTIKAGEEASTTVALTGKAVAALEGTWALVTDASSLKAGDEIIIAAKDYDVALSTTQNNNNRGEIAITKNGNLITATSEVQVLTLQAGKKENTLALYTGAGYLHAASSGSNHLKTETTLSDNSSWTISIANGTATLTAQGTYTRNTMFYNPLSKIFACYASNTTTQKAIAIYKKVDDSEVLAPGFTPTGGTFYGAQSVEITCATADAEVYYTLDGTDPTSASTKYTGAISIASTTTIKAVAIKGENSSAVVSATYTILAPLATMQEIFDKATDATQSVHIEFNDWVISGVVPGKDGKPSSNAYITDGSKGFIIYTKDGHGFNVGDKLSGTVVCDLTRYNGSAEVVGLTSSTTGLSVTTGGVVTPVEVADESTLSGVNTGAVIKITGPCTVDGTKYYVAGVQLYNSLYTYTDPESGYNYECTGVYLQYNTTKEILPRKAEDLVKIETQQPAGIAFAVTEHTAEVGATDFEEPELTNPNSLTVTYKTSDATLATINATTGEVTIGNKAGKVTITASFAGSDDFVAADASYNITITDPSISTVTFDATIDKTPDAETLSLTKDVITMTFTGGAMNNGENYRCYKNQTLTISAIDASIQKIEFECTSSNPISGFADATGLDKTNSVWTGDAKSIELTASNNQVRMSKVNVYYKKDNRADAGLAWNPATVSLTVGDAFTAPTFSNPNGLTVSFESSNTDLATVNNAGVISLVSGKTGTATITATYAGNETYKPAEVTCAITVDHKSEDVVILAKCKDQYYALVAEYVEEKNDVLQALPVEYVGGKIYNVETEDQASIIWKRVVVDGKTTFKNGDNYLSAVNSAALNLATEACEWVFEGDMYKIEGSTRTILYYTSTGGFKNYSINNMSNDGVNGEYSSVAITVAPVFADGDAYHRTVTSGNYGTICLPFGSTNYSGATFYECVGSEPGKVYLGSVTALEAGVPYIFQATATATELAVYSDGTTATEAGKANGLVGTFADNTPVPNNAYILYGGAFCTNNDETKPNKINAYRAYLDLSAVNGGAPQQMPGRRYIGMDVQGENGTTGLDDIMTTGTPVKVIENGQLIIIRNGEKYNVQGQKL